MLIAREAVELIATDYEVLDPVTDMHAALQADSPSVHEGGNVLSQSITHRGDLEKAMAEAAYTTSGVYETQMIEHGFMEPEACIAYPTPLGPPEASGGGGVEVLSQGQGVFEDRVQIAKLLGLPQDQCERCAGRKRRRVWRQRGPFGAGSCGAGGLSDGRAG